MGSVIGSVVGGFTGGVAEGANLLENENYAPTNINEYDFLSAIKQSQAQGRDVYEMLKNQAEGRGPNAAALQMQQGLTQAQQQAAGTVAGTKGINPALAARLAQQQQSAMAQQQAGAAAILRQQQQQAAIGQLGQYNLGQQGINVQGNTAQNQIMSNNYNEAMRLRAGAHARNAMTRGQMFGQVVNPAGALLSQSGGGGAAAGGAGNMSGSEMATTAMYAAHGGVVPGHAEVHGDSYANDNVPAVLSPGEIVIPRSHSGDKQKAKEFIDHLMGSEKKQGMSHEEFFKSHRELMSRVSEIEKKLGKRK